MKNKEIKLLTGYLDGVLSASQRENVNELLQSSFEAREFLRLLQNDASMVRNLVPMESSFTLTQKVMSNLNVKARSRVAFLNKPDQSYLKPWVSLLAVACFLAVTTFVSFYAINAFIVLKDKDASELAKLQTLNQSNRDKQTAVIHKDLSANLVESKDLSGGFEKQNILPVSPSINKTVEDPFDKNLAVTPSASDNSKNKELLAAPANETFNLIKVNPTLPWILRRKDVEAEISSKLFSKVVSQDSRIKIEILCKDKGVAFDQIKLNLTKMGYFVYSDVSTLMRLKNKADKSTTNYLFYLENASLSDIAKLLEQSKPTPEKQPKKATENAALKVDAIPFWEALVVSEISSEDRKNMKNIIGFEPTEQGVSASSSVNDVVDAAKITTLQPSKKNVNAALALAYPPTQTLTNAPEVKQYLESIKTKNLSGIKLLVVLRTAN